MRLGWVIILWVVVLPSVYSGIGIGQASSKIRIDEVYDYQCPHCRHNAMLVSSIAHEGIDVVLHPTAVINTLSLEEVSFVYAAALMHDDAPSADKLLLENDIYDDASLRHVIDLMGMPYQKTQAMMHSLPVKKQMLEGLALLKQYHSHGVPLTVVTDLTSGRVVVLEGEQTRAALLAAIHGAG